MVATKSQNAAHCRIVSDSDGPMAKTETDRLTPSQHLTASLKCMSHES